MALPAVSSQYASAFIAPISALALGVILGAAFSRGRRKVGGLALFGWAIVSTVGLWYASVLYGGSLWNTWLFTDFSSMVEGTQYSAGIIYGNQQEIAMVVLLGIYWFGLTVGFGSGLALRRFSMRSVADDSMRDSLKDGSHIQPPARDQVPATLVVAGAQGEGATAALYQVNEVSTQRGMANSSGNMSLDERAVVELFLFGGVSKIVPRVDVSRPEGYTFDGAPTLNWDTGKLKQVLESLWRKGLLEGRLSDKMLLCSACGSPSLQLRNTCPECRSIRLSKHTVVEHFACGLIEKQEAFRTDAGDLVCPKCHVKMRLIGSDYRSLGQMYVCQECNALNRDLLQNMKCASCGATLPMDEEKEQRLYEYSLNDQAAARVSEQVKPIEACTGHFRSLGYTVVSPAFVVGRSGTKHTFDLLIIPSARNLGDRGSFPEDSDASDPHSIVVEMLISDGPVELEQISKSYGKVSDLSCESMLFAVPGLSDNARNYAAGFGMHVFEGRTIGEALSKSRISSLTA